MTTWTHHCSIPASPAWSAPAHSAGQPLTPPTLAVSQCPCFQIHPESLPPGPTCHSVRVPKLALLGRSQHHAPHKKGPPLPFLGLPGQRCPGHLHLLLLVLCWSSACSHTALTARHPRCVLEHLLSWNYGLNPVGCYPSWAIQGCHGLFCTWAPSTWPSSCPHSKPREGRQQVESNQLLFKDVARSCTHY